MTWLLICLVLFVTILLIALRFVLIMYAKTIPNFGVGEPFVSSMSDKTEERYHSSVAWLNYRAKCKELSESSKKSLGMRMYKTNTNTYREKEIRSENRLNFNKLRNVICINIDKHYADIEGSTTFDTFVSHLLKYGFIPRVVPELKSITVGGAIVGVGIESSSFKYGLVHESMIECDVLLANGNIITCTNNNKYCDLFGAIPNSLGSLGYLLRIRIKIIKCKKYVHLRNIQCKTHNILGENIVNECNNNKNIDFIEGIAYPDGTGRILMGKMMDRSRYSVNESKYTIFHKHVENNKDMIIPIDKYLWRWDSDLFWCLQYVKPLNNKYIRWYLGPHILRSDVLRHFHRLIFKKDIIVQTEQEIKAGNNMFIQDIIVPSKYVKDWLKFHFDDVLYLNKDSPIQHPTWLCPTKGNKNDFALISTNDESINVNFGFWGTVKWDKDIKLNKYVENNLVRYQAFKTLYSDVLFNEQNFYQIYNGKAYFKLKQKYDPQKRIRGFYEKCTNI